MFLDLNLFQNTIHESFVLQDVHKLYQNTINELNKYQNQCFKEIHHQKYRLSQIKRSLKEYEMNHFNVFHDINSMSY